MKFNTGFSPLSCKEFEKEYNADGQLRKELVNAIIDHATSSIIQICKTVDPQKKIIHSASEKISQKIGKISQVVFMFLDTFNKIRLILVVKYMKPE